MLEIERGSTRSHFVENSLWKRLRACRKTDCGMMVMMMMMMTTTITTKLDNSTLHK
jgi:hypothetical protein